MKYELSKRQTKELAERGRELCIAIPLPSWIGSDAEIMAHVRKVLPVNHEWVISCYGTTIDVITQLTSGSSGGLTGRLGTIVQEGDVVDGSFVVAEMSVALVDLCAVSRPRGRHGKIQWPAAVTIDGNRFPSE